MADNGICAAVLENSFAALRDLGVPFSVCLHLLQSNLKLAEAHWTARSTFIMSWRYSLRMTSGNLRGSMVGGGSGRVMLSKLMRNKKFRKSPIAALSRQDTSLWILRLPLDG